LVALVFTGLNYVLSRKRRSDDLFDRRYSYYERVKERWLATQSDGRTLDQEDCIEMAEEATFLFGNDVHRHVVGLADRRRTGSPFFADEDFVKPFRKYLNL
jgi:hypothetical protein